MTNTESAPSAASLVSLREVTKTFRRSGGQQVQALRGITVDIPAGSKFGVVGESGSGKTTLMRIIAGLESATSGTVTVAGQDITNASEKDLRGVRRRLQVVFQDPMGSLNPRMRIGKIVAEPLLAQGIPDVHDRVATVLQQVGLDSDVIRRYPHQFSGGQRQRISIARAIAPDPEILIADEAVSALDVTVRAQILELIADIATRRSLTLIFVSHDLAVIHAVCDHVAVLQKGELVETGAVQDIYNDPQQPYTQRLLAAVPRLSVALDGARRRAAEGSGKQDT